MAEAKLHWLYKPIGDATFEFEVQRIAAAELENLEATALTGAQSGRVEQPVP